MFQTLQYPSLPTQCLKDKVILVTGSTSGIGYELSYQLACQGATVILHGRDQKKLEALYDKIVDDKLPEPAITPLNFLTAKPESFNELYESIAGLFGRLDGLVHNAGQLGQLSSIENTPPKLWLEVMHVNLNAPFLLTQTLMPLLKKSPSASLIFTTSSVGHDARAYWGAYSCSKYGVEALSQILHDELETNTQVRVNCINPGKVRTKMRAKAYPGEDPSTLPTPSDIVNDYIYLLSDESVHVSGKSINCQP